MTLKKIAEIAGVSVSTVSKAFSDGKDVSQAVKLKIHEIAKQQGCFEKYYKGRYGKKIIAVICPEIKSQYYAELIVGLSNQIEKSGGISVVSATNFDNDTETLLLKYHGSFGHADGIIMIGNNKHNIEPSVPVVYISGTMDRSAYNDSDIIIDLNYGIKKAIEHLIELGHRKIAFIGEKLTKTKEESFCKIMNACSLINHKDYIVRSNLRFEQAGYEGMEKLLSLKNRPTAIVAAYDYIAFGAMRCALEKGFDIPKDISIIGIDGIPTDEYFSVPLTTVLAYNDEMYKTAVEMIFKKIDCKYSSVEKVFYESKLILRSSTAKI